MPAFNLKTTTCRNKEKNILCKCYVEYFSNRRCLKCIYSADIENIWKKGMHTVTDINEGNKKNIL